MSRCLRFLISKVGTIPVLACCSTHRREIPPRLECGKPRNSSCCWDLPRRSSFIQFLFSSVWKCPRCPSKFFPKVKRYIVGTSQLQMMLGGTFSNYKVPALISLNETPQSSSVQKHPGLLNHLIANTPCAYVSSHIHLQIHTYTHK